MSADSPRVLVVDDDADTREAVGEVLRDDGYLVSQAPNGDVALCDLRAASELPDVILLDLMMPVMDGVAFRAEQLADPALADIPVAVFSAHARAEEAARALNADAYLEKPLELDELLLTVRRLVRRT
jgi:two-component system chemotaxis response regulator CheY